MGARDEAWSSLTSTTPPHAEVVNIAHVHWVRIHGVEMIAQDLPQRGPEGFLGQARPSRGWPGFPWPPALPYDQRGRRCWWPATGPG